MNSLLNIAFGIVTLSIIISITASKDSDSSKFTYSFPEYTLNWKPQTNETTSRSNGVVSSTEVLAVATSISSASTALPSETKPLSSQSSSVSPVALNAAEIQELGDILKQDKAVSTSSKAPQTTKAGLGEAEVQTTAPKADASPTQINGTNNNSTDSILTNATSSPTTSVPKVRVPTDETKTYNDFWKKIASWLGDQYTLSIVLPILAGFLFAVVIIVTIATFTCIRRRCRRRRLRKKILPETIRKMGPSDRARLLAETSDEEF